MSGDREAESPPPPHPRPTRTLGPRPAYLRWPNLGLVLVGGMVGVACREGATRLITEGGDMPVVVPVLNVTAAFVIGLLYEGIARLTPSARTIRRLTLTVGIGFCGGLSTYSTLATDAAELLVDGHLDLAVLYALGTLVLGGLATVLGVVVADRLRLREQVTS